jgi:hypothetical protein
MGARTVVLVRCGLWFVTFPVGLASQVMQWSSTYRCCVPHGVEVSTDIQSDLLSEA